MLLGLASLTPRRLLALAAEHPTAVQSLEAVRRGIGCSERDREAAGRVDPPSALERVREMGARLIAVGDPEYPPSLLDLFDPPAGLFVLGRPLGEHGLSVAIVGARNSSQSGRDLARALAGSLAAAGACVVSGGARGIDAAAHEGALGAGGATVAVLGCGLDIAYPTTNRSLFERIASEGSLVSEYATGTPPEPFRFPARNRIVAGLAVATVVVEGASGSGSLITADQALELGRDVFAVPGAVTSALAEAPLGLLRDGAILIRGADDLLGDLGLQVPVAPSSAALPGEAAGGLSPSERQVFEALTSQASSDELVATSGRVLSEVLSALVRLEMRGLVRQVGGRYERRRPAAEGR